MGLRRGVVKVSTLVTIQPLFISLVAIRFIWKVLLWLVIYERQRWLGQKGASNLL